MTKFLYTLMVGVTALLGLSCRGVMAESGVPKAQIEQAHGGQLHLNRRGDWLFVSSTRLRGLKWLIVSNPKSNRGDLFKVRVVGGYTALLIPVSGVSAKRFRALIKAQGRLKFHRFEDTSSLMSKAPKHELNQPLGVFKQGGELVWFGLNPGQSQGVGLRSREGEALPFELRKLDLQHVPESWRVGGDFFRSSSYDTEAKLPKVATHQADTKSLPTYVKWFETGLPEEAYEDRFSQEALGRSLGVDGYWGQGVQGDWVLWPFRGLSDPRRGVMEVGWRSPSRERLLGVLSCFGDLWRGRELEAAVTCTRDLPAVVGQGGQGAWHWRAMTVLGRSQWAQWVHVQRTQGRVSLSAPELMLLARSYEQEGSFREAMKYANAAVEAFERFAPGLARRVGQAEAYALSGLAARGRQDWEGAQQAYTSAYQLYEEAGDGLNMGRVSRMRGQVAIAQGDVKGAMGFIDQSRQDFARGGQMHLSARAEVEVGYLLIMDGQRERGKKWLRKAKERFKGLGDRAGLVHVEVLQRMFGEGRPALGLADKMAKYGSIDLQSLYHAWKSESDLLRVNESSLSRVLKGKDRVGGDRAQRVWRVYCAIHWESRGTECEDVRVGDFVGDDQVWAQTRRGLVLGDPNAKRLGRYLSQHGPRELRAQMWFEVEAKGCGESTWGEDAKKIMEKETEHSWLRVIDTEHKAGRDCAVSWLLKRMLQHDSVAVVQAGIWWGLGVGSLSLAQAKGALARRDVGPMVRLGVQALGVSEWTEAMVVRLDRLHRLEQMQVLWLWTQWRLRREASAREVSWSLARLRALGQGLGERRQRSQMGRLLVVYGQFLEAEALQGEEKERRFRELVQGLEDESSPVFNEAVLLARFHANLVEEGLEKKIWSRLTRVQRAWAYRMGFGDRRDVRMRELGFVSARIFAAGMTSVASMLPLWHLRPLEE